MHSSMNRRTIKFAMTEMSRQVKKASHLTTESAANGIAEKLSHPHWSSDNAFM